MTVKLSDILSETNETARNSTTGTLDNTKRTRAINRILQELQDFADWKFTRRTKTFYFIDGVYEYSLQNHVGASCQDNDGSTSIPDFKNPYDLRPIEQSDISLDYQDDKRVRENVRRNRFNYEYAVDNDLLIVGYPKQVSAQLHDCDSLTANGTWTASGDASNLTIDDVIYEEGSGSLNFDTTAGTSLIITNPSLASKNYTTLQNKSYLTLKVWLPTITNFTSIEVRWGSDASNYWSKTETAPAGNRDLKVGKNLFAFRWGDATQTGSPDVTAIDYLQIRITYASAVTDTDFRIDDIRIGKEVEMELDYYSLAMVRDTAGDYQLEFDPTNVTQTDELLGDSTARRCVVSGTTYELFKIIGGKAERDRTDNKKEYDALKMELFKKAGERIRRPGKILNFPGRHSRGDKKSI